jgi:pimeloyl-ACP methyl ester carboxylesterase
MRVKLYTYGSRVLIRATQGDSSLPAIWCLHGFGASGTSFLEAFEAPALFPYSVHVPDFPGFGASPEGEAPQEVASAAEFLGEMIRASAPSAGVALVAHSAGSLVAARAARSLPGLQCLISVEGNMTAADTFITARAAEARNIEAWRMDFIQKQGGLGVMDEATRRYCCDLLLASPASLRTWAVSTVAETGISEGGELFARAACRKLYVHGAHDVPGPTRDLLALRGIESRKFARSGHAPMIDEPGPFYETVARFVSGLTL